MKHNYLQLLGLLLLFPVLLVQFFRSQTAFLQPYTPYFTIVGLLLLIASFVLKMKTNGFKQYNFRIGFLLIFFFVLVLGLVLIYKLTT
ncbi:MAG: hypothetical protein EOO87_21580 [Pedobacter sp.]|nr:MAG: hypothetical protein EOO87_21580 [Pedobacter sp.]